MSLIHNIIPSTLSARFILIIAIPSIIMQMFAVFLFYDRHWYNVSYYTSNLIVNEIQWLLDEHDNTPKNNQYLINQYPNISYQLQDKSRLPKKQPRLTEELEIFKNILDTKIKKKNIVIIEEDKRIAIFIELNTHLMKITFPIKLLINPTTYIFVLWLIFLTVSLLSVSLIFSRNQIKSILELTKAAESFGSGQKRDYKPSGAYEIRKAGLAFLKMKERIEKQIAKRTQMLAMISHDLRTPLTRIKLQLELMQDSEVKEELQEDIETMQRMISSYLNFAKGETDEQQQVVNMPDWIVHLMHKQYNDSNITITACKENYNVQIQQFAFTRAIANIMENAIKYSTEIGVDISYDNKNIVISIEDNGNGISDHEKLLVFKPFYRSNNARSLDNSGSVGLGLTIAKEIISGNRGTISLKDSAKGGLTVVIGLPVTHET